MSLRFYEIAEANNRILNPIGAEDVARLGHICALKGGTRVLDLACGKGEMLSTWALNHGIRGVGVDISAVFIDAARQRAEQLEVSDRLNFVVDDAADYPQPFHEFDLVSCIGATWIGGGLSGTLDLMKTALKPHNGCLIVGEAFWKQPPPDAVKTALELPDELVVTLGETLARIEAAGLDVVEMVPASTKSFDRYETANWLAVDHFLRENPNDPDADALYTWLNTRRRNYLNYDRTYLGWAAFVLRQPPR